jgi:hypothetical protein
MLYLSQVFARMFANHFVPWTLYLGLWTLDAQSVTALGARPAAH